LGSIIVFDNNLVFETAMITLPPDAEQLARLVAQRSGKSPEEVLRQALETEARIAGVAIAAARNPRADIDLARVRDITRRIANKPLLDKRTPKEIRDQAWGEPE
jgi:antitoxin VapB